MRIFLQYSAALAVAFVFTACSSSPMKARLDKNFIYNCSLELLDKGVPGADAERICSSSHVGEMREDDRRTEPGKAKDPIEHAVKAATTTVVAPAAIPVAPATAPAAPLVEAARAPASEAAKAPVAAPVAK